MSSHPSQAEKYPGAADPAKDGFPLPEQPGLWDRPGKRACGTSRRPDRESDRRCPGYLPLEATFSLAHLKSHPSTEQYLSRVGQASRPMSQRFESSGECKLGARVVTFRTRALHLTPHPG